MEDIRQNTAGEAAVPPPVMPQTIEVLQKLGPNGSILTTVTEDGVVTKRPAKLDPFDLIVDAHASLAPTNVEGRAIMMRLSEYLENGTLNDAGRSTARFDLQVEPLDLSLRDRTAYFEAVLNPPPPSDRLKAAAEQYLSVIKPEGPRSGDLFTIDYVSFYGVVDTEDLAPSRENLVIHVPPGTDWKTAVWGYIQECDRSIQVWNANGIPTPIGPAD